MGPFTDTVPGVEGVMFAVDKSTIIITNFTYTGSDPGRFTAFNHTLIGHKLDFDFRNIYLCWDIKS